MLISSCLFAGKTAFGTTKSFKRTEAVFWRLPLPNSSAAGAVGTVAVASTELEIVEPGLGDRTGAGGGLGTIGDLGIAGTGDEESSVSGFWVGDETGGC
ncbi:unnamed protein product [Arabidopsis thaliana]|uniref:(thale cress) hypothetical protein n=1 Tax=Arabidopsis thaliana TaxID=3702 RepID=A0A7G2EP37_ARATH|nr:unnamed protein product [Arabidopsis thaliana]